jgi:hypothetical protein
MINVRKLAVVFTVASTVASVSAFAESRHREATRERSGREQSQQQRSDNRSFDRRESPRTDASRDRGYRNDGNRSDSNRNDAYRNESRNDRRYESRNDGRRNDGYRNDRGYRNDGYRNDRRDYSTHGRVTRYERYGSGYRVWIGGGYPFFVSDSYWRRYPLRIGVSVRLGGYWNPGGYWDVYDYGPNDGYYNSYGDLRGVVESIDYRRGTAVVRNEASGSFVTVALRGRDSRLGSIRPGDYVTLSGDWSRYGVFNAYNVLDVRYDRYDDRYDRRY